MRILTVPLLLVMAIPANADESFFELTPMVGYRFGGTFAVDDDQGEYELDDSESFGLLVNFPHRTETKWEILYARQDTEARFDGVTLNDAVVEVRTHTLQIGGIYQGQGEQVRPYLSATIGGTHIESESAGSESDTFFSGSIGLGVLILPTARVGVRLEARAYGTLMQSSTDLFCATGPEIGGVCAVRLKGDLLGQVETFAGIVFRF